MQVISLGGGVQSVTLTLMSIQGEIEPQADLAVFADTGWEQDHTYKYMDWLVKYAAAMDFPVHRVGEKNIKDDSLDTNADDNIPFFTTTKRGKGQLRRQCTNHYKITPIQRFLRTEFGMQKRIQWIGISLDEISRAKPSRVKYVEHRFPLLEKRLYRSNCINWLKKNGFPIPGKSACVCCPYRRNGAWATMKAKSPDEFQTACGFDEKIRDLHLHKSKRKDFPLYLHESLQPLSEVQFENPDQLSLFEVESEECEGGCFL